MTPLNGYTFWAAIWLAVQAPLGMLTGRYLRNLRANAGAWLDETADQDCA